MIHIPNNVLSSCIPLYAFANALCSSESDSTAFLNAFGVGITSVKRGINKL